MSRQYRNAWGDALHIIQKNKVVDKFVGLTNYRSASACQLNVSIEGERGMGEKALANYQSVSSLCQG